MASSSVSTSATSVIGTNNSSLKSGWSDGKPINDGGFHEVAVAKFFVGPALAPNQNRSTIGNSTRDGAFIGPYRRFVNDRSHPDIAIERVANLDRRGFLDQQPHKT